MKPRSILFFERFAYASIVLAILTAFLFWGDPSRNAQFRGASSSKLFLLGIGIWAVEVLLIYLSASKASAIAKWIYVVWSGVCIVQLLIGLVFAAQLLFSMGIAGFLSLIRPMLMVAASYYLFQPDARNWFANKGPAN